VTGVGTLLDQVREPAALARAWKVVHANDLADEILSPGVARFAEAAEARLAELAAQLACAGSSTRPPTRNGSCRTRGWWCVQRR
jgi:hypothetical protein